MLTEADARNSHQMSALAFMRQREDHNWCQEAQRDLRTLAAIAAGDNIPTFSTGGILADAMGLGKTLTMISAIVTTAREAEQFSVSFDLNDIGNVETVHRTRATLVVVTSMRKSQLHPKVFHDR
jgi:SNF2 family DNA or RNA helicase